MQFLSTPSARRATLKPAATLARANAFLSTPSARRATEQGGAWIGFVSNFYPRPPRGGRPPPGSLLKRYKHISIHALREEGDASNSSRRKIHRDFYPRPPRGGRPGRNNRPAAPSDISIHALREEGDQHADDRLRGVAISIHALREEGDRGQQQAQGVTKVFLSTPSARRATVLL